MEKTPKVRVQTNRTPVLGVTARLVQVQQGIAVYRCVEMIDHSFSRTITNPFDPDQPAVEVRCIFTHE